MAGEPVVWKIGLDGDPEAHVGRVRLTVRPSEGGYRWFAEIPKMMFGIDGREDSQPAAKAAAEAAVDGLMQEVVEWFGIERPPVVAVAPVEWSRDDELRNGWHDQVATVGPVSLRVSVDGNPLRWTTVIPELENQGAFQDGPYWQIGTAPDLEAAKDAAEAEVGPMLQRLADWVGRDLLATVVQAERLALEVTVLRPQPGDMFVLRLLKGQAPPMAVLAMLEHALLAVYDREGIDPPGTPDVLILGPDAAIDLMTDGELTALGFKRIPAGTDTAAILEAVAKRQANLHSQD